MKKRFEIVNYGTNLDFSELELMGIVFLLKIIDMVNMSI